MRPDYESLVEGQRRDLELGAALAALPQPELPDDVDARLLAAVQKERRRNRRRPGWPELLALLLIVAAVGGALAWRYVPSGQATMQQVRSAVELRRDSLIPTPPRAAIARGRMTAAERVALGEQVRRDIIASCTPRFAREQIRQDRAVQNAVQVSANALASGMEWPAPVARQPVGEPSFVRRNWDGSIVVRLGSPLLGEVEDAGDLYVLRRVDGRWLIDEIIHQGLVLWQAGASLARTESPKDSCGRGSRPLRPGALDASQTPPASAFTQWSRSSQAAGRSSV